MVRRQPASTGAIGGAASAVGSVAASAAIAGAIAGVAVGLIDGLWTFDRLGQFVSSFGKVRALVYLATSYALVTAVAATLVALVGVGLARATRLGDGLAALSAVHARAPLARLSLALAVFPALAVTLTIAFGALEPALESRKHFGLVVAVVIASTVVAVAIGVALAFLLARLIELALSPATGSRRLGRWLAAPGTALAALALTIALMAALIAWRAWATVSLLSLRPMVCTFGIAVATVSLRRPAAALATGIAARGSSALAATVSIGVGALLALLLVVGGADGPRKAATAHSGLGGPVTTLVRAAFDLDRDGFSRVLGGGDCDDWNAAINPGAPEIPEDGVDNNCVAGDATTTRDPAAARFVNPPPALPADFNVVLITIDTLRADHLGAYGYKRATSPTLDALAADGTLFENAWAHAPSTRYSIPAILTGRMPLSVDYLPIGGAWPGLAESNTTIAEVLKSRGFATGAILNYWYFEQRRKMDQGFDSYNNKNRVLHKNVKGDGPAQTSGSSSKEQTDSAIEFLETTASRRFFLWVHYYDPHFAYELHPGTLEFGDKSGDKNNRVALYDHEIRYTDDQIGRLVADLRRRGLYDKTVLVVTGDHGEGFGEHGIDLHGYHLYAAQTKVPLIVRVPGTAPSRVAMPVGHVDILPTLANLAGAPATAEMDGRSLLDVTIGPEGRSDDRVIFQQLSFENDNEMRGAVSRACHVIFNVSPHRSWEAYEIESDPSESRDVGSSARCRSTRAALESFYDRSEIPVDAMEALLASPPAIGKPLALDFGDAATLLAVDIPAEVKRGATVPLTFTWEARAGFADDWNVFVHVSRRGAGKQSGFIQADHEPARPFRWWKRGQFIRYQRALTIPASTAAGDYQVWLGLFRKDDRHPLSRGGKPLLENRALVGAISVTP